MLRLVTSFALLLALPAIGSPASAHQAESSTDLFLAFALELDQAMSEYDPTLMEQSFDFSAMVEIASKGVEANETYHKAFELGVSQSFTLGEQIVQNMSDFDGTYQFLRMLPSNPPRALFRLAGDDGLNYHELYLAQGEGGRVRIIDLYFHISGERVSTQLRRGYIAGAASADRGFLARLVGSESAYIESLTQIQEAVKSFATDPERTLEIIAALPAEVQQLSEILIIRIGAAASVDDEVHAAAIADFIKYYPDSAALDLILVDHHLLRDEFDAALKCIDRIDERVDDPYLNILRGSVLLLRGDLEAARKLIEAAAERDPRLDYNTLWGLLEIALLTDDHELTLATFTRLADDHFIEFDNLEDLEIYAAFVASPQYATWMKRFEVAEESR